MHQFVGCLIRNEEVSVRTEIIEYVCGILLTCRILTSSDCKLFFNLMVQLLLSFTVIKAA